MRCLKCVYNAKVAYINLVMYCGVHGINLQYIYPMYYMASLLQPLSPFGPQWASVVFIIADSEINLS